MCPSAKELLHCSWTCALTTKCKTNFLTGTLIKKTDLTWFKGLYLCCYMTEKHRILLFSHREVLVLCSLTFPRADGSIPVLALQPVWELEKPGGYPSVIFALATAMLVIMLLFYQDRNSSIMSFRKQPSRKNIPITSLCSQRLMALNFVKQKTIRIPKPCQTEKISSPKLRIYNKETRE